MSLPSVIDSGPPVKTPFFIRTTALAEDKRPQLQIILNCSIGNNLSRGRMHPITAVTSICRAAAAALLLGSTVAHAAGDLSRQEPIEVAVDLGQPGQHAFAPNKLRFETGKLYKLVLRNPSKDPHYFTSHGFTQLIYTRKILGRAGSRWQRP